MCERKTDTSENADTPKNADGADADAGWDTIYDCSGTDIDTDKGIGPPRIAVV